MADVQIPREAVEAGARALLKHEFGDDRFDQINPMWQHNLRERAIAALNAAAPLIVAAAFEQFADELKKRADERDAKGDDDGMDGDVCEEESSADCHTAASVTTWMRARWFAKERAAELRAQT